VYSSHSFYVPEYWISAFPKESSTREVAGLSTLREVNKRRKFNEKLKIKKIKKNSQTDYPT
jgi:hypothetical protein